MARGSTAARDAELGADVGAGSTLGGVLGFVPSDSLAVLAFGVDNVGVLGTLAVGRLTMTLGSLPSAKAAVVLDIHGYCEGREPLGNVGGGLEELRGAGKLGVFGGIDADCIFGADCAPDDTTIDGSEGRNGATTGLGGIDEADRIDPIDGSSALDLTTAPPVPASG